MPPHKTIKGRKLDDGDRCALCGMTRKQIDDSDKPCRGRLAPESGGDACGQGNLAGQYNVVNQFAPEHL
jgi:hypothetical protein